MSTIPTPPVDPSSPAAGTQPPAPAPRRKGRAVAIAVAVIGGVVLIGTAAVAGVSSFLRAGASDEVQTADVQGLTALDVDASAATFTIVFDDVDEAVLDVTDSQSPWSMSRAGGELSIDRNGGLFGGWWLFGDGTGENVVLTLPGRLRDAGLDGDLNLSGGSLTAEGAFGDLAIEVGAGHLSFDGSATDLDVRVSAGRADLTVEDVSRAGLTVAAGRLDAELTGSAPSEVSVDVSAGRLDLALPEAAYAVDSEVVAGSFDNRLDVSASSRHAVSVEVAAGEATIRSAR